jgi:uncharacterized membrane protein YcaP (DUF421 family)
VFDIDPLGLLGIVGRVVIVYVACMTLLRVSGRREMSELSPMDLLAMLLLSETVSPALTGDDDSVVGGLVAASTLIGLFTLSTYVYRSKRLERIVHGEAVVLIEQGRVRADVMRKFRISDDDLKFALHKQGLLHVAEVARAYVEADGEITVIKRKDYEEAQRIIRHEPQPTA